MWFKIATLQLTDLLRFKLCFKFTATQQHFVLLRLGQMGQSSQIYFD